MSLTGIAAWFLQTLAGLAVEAGAVGLWAKVSNRRARVALAEACATATDAAVATAPSLAEDLRSEVFLDGVILPLVRSLLEKPATFTSEEQLADRYVDMFVQRFSARDGVDATLVRVFQTDRGQLVAAFAAFLATLKSALYASEHWREAQHYRTTEAMAVQLNRVADLLDARDDIRRAGVVDVAQALKDAAVASVELRAWPSEIKGLRMETPLFEILLARIVDMPAGRTLLVGEAGAGKSALMARLTDALEDAGVIVFAIKADQLPASLANLDDLARALGVDEGLEDRIAALAGERPVALLLDQLDAVSEVMDSQSVRMRLLLQLVHRLTVQGARAIAPPPIHILVSSRPFEAAHDARFQQLNAEAFTLGLLDESQVSAMFEHLGMDGEAVDPALRRTLRRPFALKLFADIVQQGGDTGRLSPANLLDAWLAAANLGSPDERRAVHALLVALAEEMAATETLWRPADAFDLDHGAAVRRAEAVGLVLRSGGKIGFSHQSWFDDFQAKGFRSGGDLARHVWVHQDSLFVRASILRGLERLRRYDEASYEAALSSLLGDLRTRRHIRHLVIDLIATVENPHRFEIGWVDHMVRHDVPLGVRALRQLAPRWAAWRDRLRPLLPTVMVMSALQWQAVAVLAQEARHDANHVAALIDRHWSDPVYDRLVFDLLEQAGRTALDTVGRLCALIERTDIDQYGLANLISSLRDDERHDEAIIIARAWVDQEGRRGNENPRLHDLEKLAAAAPRAFAEAFLPWVVAVTTRGVEEKHNIIMRFPRSETLPHDWASAREPGSAFLALRAALQALGKNDPAALWALLEPITSIAVDQVQELVAVGLAAAGPALADETCAYLLGDPRRLEISHIITDVGGVIQMVDGWHSQRVLRAIVPALDEARLVSLRDMIENWSRYTDAALAEDQGDTVAQRYIWADEHRMPLLAILPEHLLPEERRAAIKAWAADRPAIDVTPREPEAHWVGSPMTAEEMVNASDDDIRALLDRLDDAVPDSQWSRPISRSGGGRELAQAFAAFAKTDPDRGLTLAQHLQPGRHEMAAGALLRELARVDAVDPERLVAQIAAWDDQGFASPDWRQDAAHALQDLARRTRGLDDTLLARLDAWLETDPDRIAAQVERRIDFEAGNPPSDRDDDPTRPLLLDGHAGPEILPQHNFTILSAVADGLLLRAPPAYDVWAERLIRHADDPEDPAVWTGIFWWRGGWLLGANPARVTALLDRLWRDAPGIFLHRRIIGFLWRLRGRIGDTMLIQATIRLAHSSDPVLRQAAGELLGAAHLLDADSHRYRLLFNELDRDDPRIGAGVIFSSAAAWREPDPALRGRAHDRLMAALPDATGGTAHAIARALTGGRALIPDKRTRALLTALPNHAEVLDAAVNHQLTEALQGLLYYPGFDEVVLALLERMTERLTGSGRSKLFLGQALVQIAIALQRSEGPLRARAMDVYERLLDAAVHGAEQAAKASLDRT